MKKIMTILATLAMSLGFCASTFAWHNDVVRNYNNGWGRHTVVRNDWGGSYGHRWHHTTIRHYHTWHRHYYRWHPRYYHWHPHYYRPHPYYNRAHFSFWV